jgi:hypothetical protein
MAMIDAGGRTIDPHLLESKKLFPVALIGAEDTYASVKAGFQNILVKNRILTAFTDYIKLAKEGKAYSNIEYAGEHISECITDYPKVILENHFDKDYQLMLSDIQNLGELRLPFPMLTIITGEKTHNNDETIHNEEYGIIRRGTRVLQDGTINLFNAYFMVQRGDKVLIHAIFNKPNARQKSYYICSLYLGVENGKMQLYGVENYDEAEFNDPDTIGTIAAHAVIAIHTLTLSGGDIYMDAPTPDQAAVNRKRVSKGKKPLVEFRLITVDTKKKDTEVVMHHGTHASPRQHWRRGHWRTAPKSGKQVWIDPILVGDEKNGKIIKDYAVGHYEERRA